MKCERLQPANATLLGKAGVCIDYSGGSHNFITCGVDAGQVDGARADVTASDAASSDAGSGDSAVEDAAAEDGQ
jgi:hypothetical protein